MPGLAVLLTVGLLVFLATTILIAAHTLTHPPRRTYASAVARGRAGDPSELDTPRTFQSWTLQSRGMDLPVWDIPGDLPPGSGPTIIVTHGWGDSRIGGLVRVEALAPLASRLLLWDLPGHGEAPGRCALGTRELQDLLAMIERADDGAAPLILYGWSLGGGLSIAAAADSTTHDRPIRAVIAEAPYRLPMTPARNVMRLRAFPHRANLPPAFWLLGTRFGVGPGWTGFDRAAHASGLPCPLLVLHGTQDAICPIDDGRAIAEAAPDGHFAPIEDGGHNDLWTDPALHARCAEAVRQFVQEHTTPNHSIPAHAATPPTDSDN